jgi:hypothetical protein
LSRIDRGTDAKVDGALGSATSRTRRTDSIRRAVTGNKRRSIAVLAASALLGSAGIALAGPSGSFTGSAGTNHGLAKFGPLNPENGFPDWYRDKPAAGSGLAPVDLEGCYDARDPYCNAPPVPDPTKAPSLKDGNFPDEFFYMLADASLTGAGGNAVLAEFAVEGAFAADVSDGQQMVFGRTRYRVRGGLQPNATYTFTTPYGVDKVLTDGSDMFVTEDIGASAGQFDEVFGSKVGPFLRWDPAVAPAAPDGYVGDPAVEHKVVGGTDGRNYVKIEGPGIGGPGAAAENACSKTSGAPNFTAGPLTDCIYTDLFSLTGKKSTRGGVEVARATYSRDGNGIQFDTMAGSKTSQDIVVQDPAATRRFPATKLVSEPDGESYYAHVKVTGTTKPDTVDVVNTSDVPRTLKNIPLVDLVTATADYDTGTGSLTVKAKSSDTSASTAFTLPEYTAASFDETATATVATTVPPATVTVKSNNGGAVTVPVTISGTTATAPLALKANAGPDQTNVTSGTKVKLDGTGSTGNIDGYAWTAVTADAPALTGADTATPAFTAANTGTEPLTYTYSLTVTSTESAPTDPPATDEVSITIQPEGADTVAAIAVNGAATTPDAAVSIPRNLPVTLDASASKNADRFLWVVTDGPDLPAGTAVDGPKLAYTYPKTTGTVIKLVVKGPGGTAAAPTSDCDTDPATGCRSTTVRLSGQPDDLTVTKARFIADSARWIIDGTATSTNANNVHVYSGVTITADREIGSSAVLADGTWSVDVRGSAIPLTDCDCVTLVSDRGGELQRVPLEKQLRLPATDVPADIGEPLTTIVPGATITTAAAATAARTVAAVPLAGTVTTAAAALTTANVTVAPTVSTTAVAASGLALTVSVPQGITLLQVRVLASTGRPVYKAFQLVRAGQKAKIKIRSAKLRRALKSGKRYTLEVRAGTSRSNLGKPVVKKFRVNR